MKLPKNHTNIWKNGKYIDDFLEFSIDRFDIIDDNTFHIGQGYDGKTCQKYICKCGNDKFNVGDSNYYTAIKCIKCGLEICVHEG